MALDEATIVQTLMAERVKLLAYIWSIVHDAHLVEDVFQEVSLWPLRSDWSFTTRKPCRMAPRSARLVSIAAMRHQGRRPTLLREDVLDQLDAAWRMRMTRRPRDVGMVARLPGGALGRISPVRRASLRRSAASSQIAEKLDMTVHSVYVALGRIHRNLRECIQRQREQEGASRGYDAPACLPDTAIYEAAVRYLDNQLAPEEISWLRPAGE